MTDHPTGPSGSAHTPTHGRIPGDSAAERAVAIAGLLAELGVQSLELRTPAGARTLYARTTDLPGLLTREAPCRLEAPGLTIDVARDAADWQASPEVAARLARRP